MAAGFGGGFSLMTSASEVPTASVFEASALPTMVITLASASALIFFDCAWPRGAFDGRFRAELGDGHASFGVDNPRLRIRHAGLLQILARLFGQLLGLVGDLLLLGDLAVGERLHQRFRRRNVADQRVDGVHVVLAKRRGDRRPSLPPAARCASSELDHVRGLRRVAEVVADGRLQHLRHQVRHVPNAQSPWAHRCAEHE
jgi:hypothetical protein